ncbi:MAG: SdiA-regulated domain-containing protein, partial [Chitinophagales bacterium]|nr:SdiA-regulated domain-containing protein [Chitinophagales bacterium]
LYQTDDKGTILRKAPHSGLDFEGVTVDENYVYVVEEMTRTIILFDKKNLEKTGIRRIAYHGARNKGYESIAYNEAKKCFVLITERDPIWIHELDENFLVKNEVRFKNASDISAATFYNGKLYLLSDENHAVFQVNPMDYTVEKIFKLNVINPEGICFSPNGVMKILSDDMAMLFDYRLFSLETVF